MLFGDGALLNALWAIPALVALALVAAWARRRAAARWGDAALWRRLSAGASEGLRWTRLVLALCALGLAIVAAARPQVGARLVQVERRGIDLVFVLDVSLSMEATDVVPSRLDRSKQEIREILDGLRGDRTGIVVFSGDSFLLCPLTLDAVAANLFLDAVDADVLPAPGTNLEAALDGALRAFGADDGAGRGRAVVLFTDGEGHEGDALGAAERLAAAGVTVLTVGVGTPGGEPIPVRDSAGRIAGYKKDRGGNVVLSRLDEGILRRVAETTGGRYFPATLQGREVGEILETVSSIQKGELGEAFRRRVEERFQVPAGIALVFLALALATPEARRARKEGGR